MAVRKYAWILLFLMTCDAAKVLIVIPFQGKSHYIAQKDIGLELAKKGHEVTVITSHKEPNPPPTYKQVIVDPIDMFKAIPNIDEKMKNPFTWSDMNFLKFQFMMYAANVVFTEHALNCSEVQAFIAQKHQFDVVIVEVFFQEAMFMFSHMYNAPLILIQTFGSSMKTNFYVRNPLQLSTVMHEYGAVTKPGSFLGRLQNLVFVASDIVLYKLWYKGVQEQLVTKYFKNIPLPRPSVEEVARDASLVLMNSHFSADTPTAFLPNVIEVGGLNIIMSDKDLPKDLQKYLDESKEGVVYMSLGSNVNSTHMSPEKRDAFVKVFGKLKHKVIWKWEETDLPGISSNILIRDWLPQKEILKHPNTKLFIAHGGLIGLHEAIFSGVPVLGIPVFGDQYHNILQASEYGYGELLEYKNINEENLFKLVNKMLTTKSYSETARAISKRFKDRPMTGLDTAIWWIEYVIRNKGAYFMRSPARVQSIVQYTMLDVYGFLIIVLLLLLFIFWKALIILSKAFTTKGKHKTKKS